MADWSKPLPAEAVEGSETHIEDHNALVGALQEVRANVDEAQEAASAAQVSADSKQDKGSYASESALSALTARVKALEDAAEPEPAG